MLLARGGLRVLVADPLGRGTDTMSTHALMRGGVLQLHRWGLLGAIRSAETPPIRTTTFHYGEERVEVPIKPRDGVDALYAPRRTVLDPVLVDAAADAGASVVHGQSVVDLLRDTDGRVRGVRLTDAGRRVSEVSADLVVGADGVRSRVARLVNAGLDYAVPNAAASIYGYWKDIPMEGNHWFYEVGGSVGTIPTNGGDTCVFALLPRSAFETDRAGGLPSLHRRVLTDVSPELADCVASGEQSSRLRAFAGIPGFLRRSVGPGWALVGDAGYFRDPITAHGITDALRDAEFLARAVMDGSEEAMEGYQAARNELVRTLLEVTDRLSSFEWDLDEARELHLALSREMRAEVDVLLALDAELAPEPL